MMRRGIALLCCLAPGLLLADTGMNEHAMDPWFARTDIDINRRIDANGWDMTYRYLGGPDQDKLLIEIEAETEGGRLNESSTDLFYAKPVGTWGLLKAGASYRQRPSHAWRAAVGYEYLWPGFVRSDITVYGYAGEMEADLLLERPTALTNRLSAYPGIEARYASYRDTGQEIGKGWNRVEPYFRLEWKFNPNVKAYTEYRYKKALGEYRNQKQLAGEDPDEHRWALGLSLMF